MTDMVDLAAILATKEDEHLECKEAKSNFDVDDLSKYCAALANEGGGRLVLGVTNRAPRRVVGSRAFPDLARTQYEQTNQLRLRVEASEITDPAGRVVVFDVPSRPIGMPVNYKGAFWMRSGESVVPMTIDQMKRILDESGPDFSAEICDGASLADLHPDAVAAFRAAWRRKSGQAALDRLSDEQLLADAELLRDGQVTYAALVLLGTSGALDRLLSQAEIVFEHRSSEQSVGYQHRREYRVGFFLCHDDVWGAIDSRNDVQHFQEGLFVYDVPTFGEAPVREAVLNAVCHRDYRLAGSVFVRQTPTSLSIVSPGGFPPGVTTENILWRQSPRNRRIAEALARCGLVERSGQGMDKIFGESIRESKPIPDFDGTDDFQVSITLRGAIQDPAFLRFLERCARERRLDFGTDDLVVLDCVHGAKPVPERLHGRLLSLADNGIIEPVGRGRGRRYILSRQFYEFLGKKGVYTRARGLDRDTNKALLLKHVERTQREGSQFQEFGQVLPALSRHQIASLIREMQRAGQIHCVGRTRAGRWYPGPATLRAAPDASEEGRR